MRVAVCPHDTAKNKVLWIDVLTYLGRRTGLPFSLVPCPDFPSYYRCFEEVDLTFSNPLDALRIKEMRGFVPIAASDNHDEVVFIAHPEVDAPSFQTLIGQQVPAVENQFATLLGRYILRREGVNDYALVYLDSWQEVLRKVSQGLYPVGFLYKDFYDQLSRTSRELVRAFYASDERLAAHLFMIDPALSEERTRIRAALEEMPADPEGRRILETLRISTWQPWEDLAALESFVQTAVG